MQIRWSRLGVPLCLFNRHSPVSATARWDGKYYSGHCRYCGADIVRKVRSTWTRASGATG